MEIYMNRVNLWATFFIIVGAFFHLVTKVYIIGHSFPRRSMAFVGTIGPSFFVWDRVVVARWRFERTTCRPLLPHWWCHSRREAGNRLLWGRSIATIPHPLYHCKQKWQRKTLACCIISTNVNSWIISVNGYRQLIL